MSTKMSFSHCFIAFFLLLNCFQKAIAQDISTPKDSTKKATTTAQVLESQATTTSNISPSPDPAGLARYAENEVDLVNGLVPITIPLCTIESGNLKQPVFLGFHSAGPKVNDIASSSGLGWSLFSGGVITRNMIGRPDEYNNSYLDTTFPTVADENSQNNDFLCFLGRLASFEGSTMDGSPDGFFYNYSGNSGKFQIARRDRNQNAINATFVSVPYKPIKIDYYSPTNSQDITRFTITDTDGTKYYSGQVDGSPNNYIERTQVGTLNYISSWYLNKIESAVSNDVIDFTYSSAIGLKGKTIFPTSLLRTKEALGDPIYKYLRPQTDAVPNAIFPQDIFFKNGKVHFDYVADRQDLITTSNTPAPRLSKVTLYKKAGSIFYDEVKHFTLSQSYFSTGDGYSMADGASQPSTHQTTNHLRKFLKLDKVTEGVESNEELPPHQVFYNETAPLSIFAGLGQDYWGYFNGKNSQESRLLTVDTDAVANYSSNNPFIGAEPSTAYGADRTPDFAFGNLGNISHLIIPTGGKIKYNFGANKHSNGTVGGGARIESIETFENELSSSFSSKKEFNYTGGYFVNSTTYSNLASAGFIYTSEYSLGVTQQGGGGDCESYSQTLYTENQSFMLGSGPSNIGYGEVEIKEIGENNNHNGKLVKTFTTEPDEYKQLVKVDPNTGYNVFFNNMFYANPAISKAWKRGQLSEEKFYNSNNILIKKIQNNYTDFYPNFLSFAYVSKVLYQPDISGISNSCYIENSAGQLNAVCGGQLDYTVSSNRHIYEYVRLDTEIGYRKLTGTTETNYDENGANPVIISAVNTFHPDHNRQQLMTETSADSQGRILVTSNLYPNDFPNNSTLAIMVTKNIIAPSVKTTVTRGGLPVSEATKTFGIFGNYPKIAFEEFKYGTGSHRILASYSNYDASGNLLEMSLLNGLKINLEYYNSGDYGKTDLLKKFELGNINTSLKSQSNTFNYKPLVGKILETDINGLNTSYLYDILNRLKSEADHFGNIVQDKTYQYAYSPNPLGFGLNISSSSNSIITKIPRDEQPTLVNNENRTNTLIDYIDGLGRNFQSVLMRGSSNKGADLAYNSIIFDKFGRNYKSILPVSSPGGSSLNAESSAKIFYNDTYPFSETKFEASPLNRPSQIFGPGQNWRLPSEKKQVIHYESAGDGIPIYTTTSNSITFAGNYPSNSLFKTRIVDENDHTTIEIKDTEGNLIQSQQQGPTGYLTTHYVYNEHNQIVAIIQPEAYPIFGTVSSTADHLFFYNYDDKGQIIEKKAPSAEAEYFVYDRWDNLVYSQNGYQRHYKPTLTSPTESPKWVFYKSDALNRPAYSGLQTLDISRVDLQSNANNSLLGRYETRNTNQSDYSLGNAFPSVNSNEVLSVNYFDDYTWRPSNMAFQTGYHAQQTTVLGLPTGTKARRYSDNSWLNEVYYFDYKYRPIQIWSENKFGKLTRADLQYNFVDDVLKAKIEFNYLTSSSLVQLTENEYDHGSRQISSKTTLNGVSKNIIKFDYNAIGQLISKKFAPINPPVANTTQAGAWNAPSTWAGNLIPDGTKLASIKNNVVIPNNYTAVAANIQIDPSATLNFQTNPIQSTLYLTGGAFQSVDYAYHIRGGLLGINLDENKNPNPSTLEKDIFSYKLGYDFNNNINTQTWKKPTSINNISNFTQRAYSFAFDEASRLNTASFSSDINTENYNLTDLGYDKNSNINRLKRSGLVNGNHTLMDDLNYSYSGNKLNSVTDGVGGNNTVDFAPKASNSRTYYTDGSLLSDGSKDITEIHYDPFLMLPITIKLTTNRQVEMDYKLNGELLERKYKTIGVTQPNELNEYVSGLLIKTVGNNRLESIPIPEGRAISAGGLWETEYNITDHLGNVRAVFGEANYLPVLKELKDFDPTGVEMLGLTQTNNSTQNTFEFQDKESLSSVFGLNGLNDFGPRFLDKTIGGIWSQTDILGELNANGSPFSYLGGRYLNMVDPTGMDDEDPEKKKKIIITQDPGAMESIPSQSSDRSNRAGSSSVGLNPLYGASSSSSSSSSSFNQGISGAFPNGTLRASSQQNARIGPARDQEFGSHFSPEEKAAQLGVNMAWAVEGGYGLLKGGFGLLRTWFGIGKTAKNFSTSLVTKYPSVAEIAGTSERTYLMPGDIIDRYGPISGKWFSPANTSYGARSIPEGLSPHMKFKVLKPFEVNRSLASPGMFSGQTGFGTQFQSPVSVKVLLKRKLISPF